MMVFLNDADEDHIINNVATKHIYIKNQFIFKGIYWKWDLSEVIRLNIM